MAEAVLMIPIESSCAGSQMTERRAGNRLAVPSLAQCLLDVVGQ
ncbi:MAG: hypothetical protein KatS3mg059_0777 [Thermomicrobiales bacterium]|nr:MAG: hypothetical protein KatS3mg059_0777 [Thermomicrobiales bacterium]